MILKMFISTNNKKFSLLLTTLVLIAGAVTMSLEFAASRLLIPIFGSSIYTWGSLIGVILAGLSIGYHLGGRLADKKDPSFLKFCSIIFSAGLYIVCDIVFYILFVYNNNSNSNNNNK